MLFHPTFPFIFSPFSNIFSAVSIQTLLRKNRMGVHTYIFLKNCKVVDIRLTDLLGHASCMYIIYNASGLNFCFFFSSQKFKSSFTLTYAHNVLYGRTLVEYSSLFKITNWNISPFIIFFFFLLTFFWEIDWFFFLLCKIWGFLKRFFFFYSVFSFPGVLSFSFNRNENYKFWVYFHFIFLPH